MNGKSSKPRPIRDYTHLANEWDRIFKRKRKPIKREKHIDIKRELNCAFLSSIAKDFDREIMEDLHKHEHQKTLGTSGVGKETHGKLHRQRRLERPDKSSGQSA
jgi:hypothetical protein